jgi:hypothetical protein
MDKLRDIEKVNLTSARIVFRENCVYLQDFKNGRKNF